MAGITALLSAAAPLLSLNFAIAEDFKPAAQASSSSALSFSLAQVAASAPKAAIAAAPTSASPTTSKPFAAPAVATLAHRNSTSPTASASVPPNGAPAPVGPIPPPQVILETNYIVYTQVRTAAPSYITVTHTVQPSPPPPPPAAQSQNPNNIPLANPDPLVALSPIPLSSSTSTPTATPQLAEASTPSPPPPAPPVLAAPVTSPLSSSSPAPPPPPPPPASTLPTTADPPPPPVLAPVMSASAPGRAGPPNPNPNSQAQTGPPGSPPMGPPDPANGAFPGGVPTKSLDLPVTVMFMLFFMLGAYVHMSIYRRNAKRGHKFLISDIVFQFCMIRTMTCVFRITWSLVTTRGVILVASITENSGAAALFAVNIFFAQRLVRSIHPKAGWCTAFGQFTLILLLSVPAVAILNATATIVSFFSVGNADRLEVTGDLLKIGSSWNTWLSVFPVLVVSGCLSVPGPKPEKFGTGSQRVKVALLYLGSLLMIVGQTIRLYAGFNKEPPGTTSVIYGKAVFYTTGFMFELIVVALYAIMRVDLRFHIPNGASGPGDYSGDKDKGSYSVEEIERLIDGLEVPHQIMRERKGPEDMEMVFTIFFATKKDGDKNKTEGSEGAGPETTSAEDAALPERPKRITRRQTLIDAIKQPPRMPRESSGYPDIPGMYVQMYEEELPPRRPVGQTMYSQFETRQGPDARYQQYGGTAPPYGNEKEGMKNMDLRR